MNEFLEENGEMKSPQIIYDFIMSYSEDTNNFYTFLRYIFNGISNSFTFELFEYLYDDNFLEDAYRNYTENSSFIVFLTFYEEDTKKVSNIKIIDYRDLERINSIVNKTNEDTTFNYYESICNLFRNIEGLDVYCYKQNDDGRIITITSNTHSHSDFSDKNLIKKYEISRDNNIEEYNNLSIYGKIFEHILISFVWLYQHNYFEEKNKCDFGLVAFFNKNSKLIYNMVNDIYNNDEDDGINYRIKCLNELIAKNTSVGNFKPINEEILETIENTTKNTILTPMIQKICLYLTFKNIINGPNDEETQSSLWNNISVIRKNKFSDNITHLYNIIDMNKVPTTTYKQFFQIVNEMHDTEKITIIKLSDILKEIKNSQQKRENQFQSIIRSYYNYIENIQNVDFEKIFSYTTIGLFGIGLSYYIKLSIENIFLH